MIVQGENGELKEYEYEYYDDTKPDSPFVNPHDPTHRQVRQADRQIGRQGNSGRQVEWQGSRKKTDRQACMQAGRKEVSEADRQTDRQPGRHADRRAGR